MTTIDRIDAALRAIIVSIFEEKLFGLYPYVVESYDSAAQQLSATPLGSGSRLPFIAKVKIRTPKLKLELAKGEQVVVAFAGGDPTQPFVANFDYAQSYGNAQPVACQGDVVGSGGLGTLIMLIPPPGPVTPVLPGVPYGVSFGSLTNPPLPSPQGMLPGQVMTGSLKVKAAR